MGLLGVGNELWDPYGFVQAGEWMGEQNAFVSLETARCFNHACTFPGLDRFRIADVNSPEKLLQQTKDSRS